MRLILLTLLLLFLFKSEPDLWDNLHAWAMRVTEEPVILPNCEVIDCN